MKSNVTLRDGPGNRILLIRPRSCPASDEIGGHITRLGFRCHEVHLDKLNEDHSWKRYSNAILLTVENETFEEDEIWSAHEGVIDKDTVVARLYSRSLSFRFLLSNLEVPAGASVQCFLWIMIGATDKITPRVYLARTLTTPLDQGICITIEAIPRVLSHSPAQSEQLRQLLKLVAENRSVLLLYWNGEISSKKCIQLLPSISKKLE